jgi:hypothetical protein
MIYELKDYDSFKQKVNLALTCLNQWFYTNQLVLNITKTNVIKFTITVSAHVPLGIYYKDNLIDEVKSTTFLGMCIDNHMNWKNHINQTLSKLSTACFSIRNLIHTLKPDILRMVYFAYFYSILTYGIICWGNSTNVHQVFKLQKRTIRIMSGVGPRSSCRGLFKKLDILPAACQYILYLMLFIVDNLEDFQTNAYIHGLDTRNKNQLHLPMVNLSCAQKGVPYRGIKIFNNLPSYIQIHRSDRKKSKTKLYGYLITHSFCSITEFLECKTDMKDI